MLRLLLAICALLTLSSCFPKGTTTEPKIFYSLSRHQINSLPSPFPPLNQSELKEDWGKEYKIGVAFGKDLDFYRSITAFKRGLILSPPSEMARRLEMQYDILLCYYFSNKYTDVISSFDSSDLPQVSTEFVPFDDLLVILHDSCRNSGQIKREQAILQMIAQRSPEKAKHLALSSAIFKGDMKKAAADPAFQDLPPLVQISNEYKTHKKSVGKARLFNALFPGAGYWYVGQKNSAVTSFLINGLFIASAITFFNNGYLAAGLVTSSLEMGWYMGGIVGAGMAAKEYNDRLYESVAQKFLYEQRLFPVLMLQYGF